MNDTMVRYFNITIEPHVHTIKNGSYEFVAVEEKADIQTVVRHFRCSFCKAIVHGVIEL